MSDRVTNQLSAGSTIHIDSTQVHADRNKQQLSKSYDQNKYNIDNTQSGSNDDMNSIVVTDDTARTGGPSVADCALIDTNLQPIYSSLIQIRDALRTAKSSNNTFPSDQLHQCQTMLIDVHKNTLNGLIKLGGTQCQPAGVLQLVTVVKQVEYLLQHYHSIGVPHDGNLSPRIS